MYFSEKEFYPGLKIGDKVGYLPRNGHKGVNADNVRNLIPQTEKLIPNVQGIVSRTSDHNRAGLGLVTVDVSKLSAASLNGLDVTKFETVPFRMADIDSNTIPHGYKLEEGDKLSFTLSRVHDSSFYLVTQGKFISSKKTMASTDMIQRMLDAGAKREMGVVTSVIKGLFI